ncbi:hypothetical protein GCM10010176_038620 [Nonomuraea spiralis]|nr:hypothetical protein GCM10010176_038620 [Nonomuraea spiralis]
MKAVYFGDIKVWGHGTGNGPWGVADLENGLFSGVNPGCNAGDPSVSHRHLTAAVKGEPNQLGDPGRERYLRHQNYQLHRQHNDGGTLFAADAAFCPQPGRSGQGTSFASANFPDRFLRHYDNTVHLAANGGSGRGRLTARRPGVPRRRRGSGRGSRSRPRPST